MTFGGQIIIDNGILGGDTDLFDLDIVNPFLDLDLSQLSFDSVLLQENQIFV